WLAAFVARGWLPDTSSDVARRLAGVWLLRPATDRQAATLALAQRVLQLEAEVAATRRILSETAASELRSVQASDALAARLAELERWRAALAEAGEGTAEAALAGLLAERSAEAADASTDPATSAELEGLRAWQASVLGSPGWALLVRLQAARGRLAP